MNQPFKRTPTLKTAKDVENEAIIGRKVRPMLPASYWEHRKIGHEPSDFWLYAGTTEVCEEPPRIIGLLEVKARPGHRYASIWFPLRKLISMTAQARTMNLPEPFALYYAAWLDQETVLIDLVKALPYSRVEISGRRDRGHNHDIEPVLNIPLDQGSIHYRLDWRS